MCWKVQMYLQILYSYKMLLKEHLSIQVITLQQRELLCVVLLTLGYLLEVKLLVCIPV